MAYNITETEIREIYKEQGFARAEFILEQAESQLGREALKNVRQALEDILKEDIAESGDE